MDNITAQIYRDYIVTRMRGIKEMLEDTMNIDTTMKLSDQLDWCMKELFLLDNGAYEDDH